MNTLEKRITKAQEKRIKKGTLTGCHIIIKKDGETLLDRVYGCSSASGAPLKSDATYRIASMTKPVTAAALLIAQEQGLLNISDDVQKYLPAFGKLTVEGKGAAQNPIKLYMLVSHISGINSAAVEGDGFPVPRAQRKLENTVECMPSVPLSFEPGTAQQYNTAAFDVAARIIEITSGMKYDEFLGKYLFGRLGMKDTTFSPTKEQWSRVVEIHGMNKGRATDVPAPRDSVIDGYSTDYFAAGCALMSTAEDYSRFAQMLLNGGKAPDGTQIMSEESVRLMTTPVTDDKIMPGSQKWGLGVRVITDGKYVLPEGSFGWSGKYGSHFWVDPSNRLTAVYMKNSEFDGGAGCMTANELERDVMKSL